MTQNSRKYWLELRTSLIRKGVDTLIARELFSPVASVKDFYEFIIEVFLGYL